MAFQVRKDDEIDDEVQQPPLSKRIRRSSAAKSSSRPPQHVIGHLLERHSWSFRTALTCVAVDENFIVVGLQSGHIGVFERSTGAHVHDIDAHLHCSPLAIALISVTSRRLASDAHQSTHHSPDDVPRRNSFPGFGNAQTLLVSSGLDCEVRVWDVRSGKCTQSMQGPDRRPERSAGSRFNRAAMFQDTLRCLTVLERRPLVVVASSRSCRVGDLPLAFQVSEGELRVWDVMVGGQALRTLQGHQQAITGLVTLDQDRIASASLDKTARIWNASTGECLQVLQDHYSSVYSILAPSSRTVVTCSMDSRLRIWDTRSGKCNDTVTLPQTRAAQVSIDMPSASLLSAGLDGRVMMYDLKTRAERHSFSAHSDAVTCMQLIGKGKLLTGGKDGAVKLWDRTTAECLGTLTHRQRNVEVANLCVLSANRFAVFYHHNGYVSMGIVTLD